MTRAWKVTQHSKRLTHTCHAQFVHLAAHSEWICQHIKNTDTLCIYRKRHTALCTSCNGPNCGFDARQCKQPRTVNYCPITANCDVRNCP